MPTLAMIKSLFENNFLTVFFALYFDFLPSLTRLLKIRFVPQKTEEYFVNLMQDAIDLREKQRIQGINLDRIDFLNYMLQLKTKKQLTTRQLTANTMTFLFDGFETTASVLSHCLLLVRLIEIFYSTIISLKYIFCFSLVVIANGNSYFMMKLSLLANWTWTRYMIFPIWMHVFMVLFI